MRSREAIWQKKHRIPGDESQYYLPIIGCFSLAAIVAAWVYSLGRLGLKLPDDLIGAGYE